MVRNLNRKGFMAHPATGVKLDFASLQFGGNYGSGGIMCRSWDQKDGLRFYTEPEPELYGEIALRKRMEESNSTEIPLQPEPPGMSDPNEN